MRSELSLPIGELEGSTTSLAAEVEVYLRRTGPGLQRPAEPYTIIDLFSGAGGLTAGFTEYSGHFFQPVLAIDNNASAIETYNANFGNLADCSLEQVDEAVHDAMTDRDRPWGN